MHRRKRISPRKGKPKENPGYLTLYNTQHSLMHQTLPRERERDSLIGKLIKSNTLSGEVHHLIPLDNPSTHTMTDTSSYTFTCEVMCIHKCNSQNSPTPNAHNMWIHPLLSPLMYPPLPFPLYSVHLLLSRFIFIS